MKFAHSMLLDFVTTGKSAEEIGDLLTMAGFELEGIDEVEGEKVLDVKVMSNRGDGLSVLGLAREVLAKDLDAKPTDLYERAASRFPASDVNASEAATKASVSIESRDCTRFAARVFEGDFSAKSPEFVQKRLRVAGIRSISLLVDLTNYVMLEVGQPLHAYDLDKLAGHKIVVRNARPGEKLVTLNGDEHELKPTQMMICDGERAIGVPGVMGGLDTEVTDSTTRMLLESANFVNTTVRRLRKELGLSTEASYRFERSVDPEGCVAALNRFAELLASVDGGKSLVPGVIDVYPGRAAPRHVEVRIPRAEQLLGMDVGLPLVQQYLERLGFQAGAEGETLRTTVPSWRPDIEQEYDLVEEIGRVHGFDKIPEALLQGTTTQGGVFGVYELTEDLRNMVMRLGFVQNISHSLRDIHPLDDPAAAPIRLPNPASPEMAYLRNSLWPNLADNARRNGSKNLSLFEIGVVFGLEGALSERKQLALLSTGSSSREHWEKGAAAEASFYSLKAAVEDVLEHAGVDAHFAASQDPRLHPTRQAHVLTAGEGIVLMGQIHPDAAQQLDLPAETFLGQFDLERLYENANFEKRLKPISRNPAVRRDIAILIDRSVPYSSIAERIEKAAGDVLEKHWLFDLYAGKGIPEGKHSLGIALQLRKFGANFTDEEANQVRDEAVQALAELGATQR